MKANILSLMLALGLAASCANHVEEENSQRVFGPDDFDVSDCRQYNPLAGEDLLEKSFSIFPSQTEYFNKKFFPGQFEASLNASAYSVAQRLFNEGVDLYQIPTDYTKSCNYFAFLHQAPETKQAKWDQIISNNMGSGILLGLFSTTFNKNMSTQQTILSGSSILVLDTTQKWTLLHEMSHYLYAKALTQQKNLMFKSELESKVKVLRTQINKLRVQLEKRPQAKTAERLVAFYRQYFNTNHELDSRTALEEFTIESQLLEKATTNEITGIDFNSNKDNAIRYMLDNSAQVVRSYENFHEKLQQFKLTELDPDWKRAVVQTENLQKKVERIVFFIKQKLLQAMRSLESPTGNAFRNFTHPSLEPTVHHFDIRTFQERHKSFDF